MTMNMKTTTIAVVTTTMDVTMREYVVKGSIQATLDAIPYDEPAKVIIPSGVYHEKLTSAHQALKLVGEGQEKTIIWQDEGGKEVLDDGYKRGTFRTSTAYFFGEQLTLEGLTIRNDAGDGRAVGQAVALYLDVRHVLVKDVTLFAHQDTLFLAPLPLKEREPRGFVGPGDGKPRLPVEAVFIRSTISGDIDFIFGGADALFQECTLISLDRGEEVNGYVTAPSGFKSGRGFVFDHCAFSSDGCADGSVYLMRPWRPEGKITLIASSYGKHINAHGVSTWQGLSEERLFTFDEYDPHADTAIVREAPARQIDKTMAQNLIDSFKFER